jgi:dihydropyrimidinase
LYETVIAGGTVVTPGGARHADVAISDGRVARIAAGDEALEARRTIDARGLFVLPGGVDPHVHAPPTGLAADPEPDSTEGPTRMSRAALLGGTTTLIDFATADGSPTLAAGVERREGHWRDALCDHAFHVLLRDDLDTPQLDEIADLVASGNPSFKIFTTAGLPARKSRLHVAAGKALAALERIARAGGILTVHGEDDELVRWGYEHAARERRISLVEMPRVRSSLAEEVAFRRMITLARRVEGACIYFMHVTSREGVEAIIEARSRGAAVYGEVLHNFLVFDASYYERSDGALFHTYPSLRGAEHHDALASAVLDGHLSVVATDGSLGARSRKLEGRTLLDARGGHSGVQVRLAVAYTELVHRRGMSLEAFVQRTATAPARIFGLHQSKGVLQEGNDADIVLFDPADHRTLRAADLIEADYSVWDGYEVAGWPRSVMLRGAVVVERDAIIGAPAGRLVRSRQVDDAVRGGASL